MKTKSGATAVQIVWSSRLGARSIEHIGSAHDDAELEALKAPAGQRIAAGQLELDPGLEGAGPAGPLPITEPASEADSLRVLEEAGVCVPGLDSR